MRVVALHGLAEHVDSAHDRNPEQRQAVLARVVVERDDREESRGRVVQHLPHDRRGGLARADDDDAQTRTAHHRPVEGEQAGLEAQATEEVGDNQAAEDDHRAGHREVEEVAESEEHRSGAEAGREHAARFCDARVAPHLPVEAGEPVGADVDDDRDRQEDLECVPLPARHVAVEAQDENQRVGRAGEDDIEGEQGHARAHLRHRDAQSGRATSNPQQSPPP